jgi:hypothetical protein
MADPLIDQAVQECLKNQAQAIEHLRSCSRCDDYLQPPSKSQTKPTLFWHERLGFS